ASELGCSIVRHGEAPALRLGLGSIKGLRATTRQRLLAARAAGSLRSAHELLERVRPQPRELGALVWSGACDGLLGLAPDDHPWVHEALLALLARGDTGSLAAERNRARERSPREPRELVERHRALSRVQRELEYLDMHISDHPMR